MTQRKGKRGCRGKPIGDPVRRFMVRYFVGRGMERVFEENRYFGVAAMTREGHRQQQTPRDVVHSRTGIAGGSAGSRKSWKRTAGRGGIDPGKEPIRDVPSWLRGRLLLKLPQCVARAQRQRESEAVRKLGEIELAKVREMNKIQGWYWSNRCAWRSLPRKCNTTMRLRRQVGKIGEKMIGEFRDWRVPLETAYNVKMRMK